MKRAEVGNQIGNICWAVFFDERGHFLWDSGANDGGDARIADLQAVEIGSVRIFTTAVGVIAVTMCATLHEQVAPAFR